MTTTAIAGSVSGFTNPTSNRAQSNIQITLYNALDEQRLVTFIGSLTLFETAGLDISLSSDSEVVGKINSVLSVVAKPDTSMSSVGTLVINFPLYYENSGSDQMIGEINPSCSADDKLTITNCIFNFASRQLTISYENVSG